MADSIDILKKLALQVRNASAAGENTAERVGRTLVGIIEHLGEGNIDELAKYFLRKDQKDQTEFLVKFLGGIEIGKFVSGLLGTGGAIQIDKNNNSHAEFDYLTIRKLAIFIELIIQEAKHVGGMLIVSPSGMTISKVEETDTAYRCYFEQTDGDRTICNQFTVGTQARRQTFNLTHQAYYWRLVTAVGSDYIDLNKTDCDTGSTIPQVGDELVGLGHRSDKTRQAAIIISAFGTNSPSIMYYQGIDSFSLEGRAVKMDYYDPVSGRFKSVTYGDTYVGAEDRSTYMKYDQDNGVEVKGRVSIQAGSNGWKNMDGLPEEIQAAADLAQQAQDDINNAAVGSVNLLLNSGFTGNYETEDMDGDKQLDADTELYSKALLNWSGMATVQEDAGATSGRSATIGSLSQSVTLIPNEVYVISYKAKGTSLVVSCGDYSVSQPVTAEYQWYTHKFTFTGAGVFLISGSATVCDLQLERGTIATDWKPSILDNDKTNAKFQTIQYLYNAMKDGSVDVLGGLVLATMIMVGNYKDGVLQKVTAGISGIYNDDDDLFTWGGGSMEQAIYTVMKYKDNPQYVPTEEELLNMAKVVITHGGRAILNDVIVRGYIYALGGFFRGKVETAVNGKKITIDPSENCIKMTDETGKELLKISFFKEEGFEYESSQIRMVEYVNGEEIADMVLTGQSLILTDLTSDMSTTISANGGLTSVNRKTKDSIVITAERVSLKKGDESFLGIDKTLLVQEVGQTYKTKLRFVHGILVEAKAEL